MEQTDIRYQCPYVEKCGACHIGQKSYEEELAEKKRLVEEHIGAYCKKINDVTGMYYPYHYRNKVHAVLGRINDEVVAGTYAKGTHTIIPISDCLIEDAQAAEIIKTVVELIKAFKLWVYDEDTGRGLMRHIIVRKAMTTKQIMVVLVTSALEFPHKNHFAEKLLERHPEITTIVQNINDRRTSAVLGRGSRLMHGKGYIEDRLFGLQFRISQDSFYQVNSAQTQVLYKKVMEAAELTGKETIIDAYCGVGTIGMCMARNSGRVIGIELNPRAVSDAKANARRNQIWDIHFIAADAAGYMANMAENGQKIDVIVMDPPRSGSTEEFINAAVGLCPQKIIYVSCNPETLGRDLALFQEKGYAAAEAWPVDMFSFTEHVEVVCCLQSTA